MRELDIIRDTEITGDSYEDQVNKDLKHAIEVKTNNFSNPQAISDVKIDMTDTIKKEGVNVDTYISKFGSVMRSEKDVVVALAQRIGGSQEDDAELAMAMAMAMQLEQEQEAERLRLLLI